LEAIDLHSGLKTLALAALLSTALIGAQPFLGTEVRGAAQPSGVDVGEILFEDTFNNSSSGWRVDSAFGFDWGYAEDDDEYRVFLTASGFLTWSPSPYVGTLSKPVIISADVRHHSTGSLATIGALGLALFDVQGGIYYFLIVPADGSYGIFYRSQSGSLETILDWRGHSRIQDVNEDTALALVLEDNNTAFYIGNSPVRTIKALNINNGGVAAATFDEPNMNARFDNFKIARIDEEETDE